MDVLHWNDNRIGLGASEITVVKMQPWRDRREQ
jgi:hypothetical protein